MPQGRKAPPGKYITALFSYARCKILVAKIKKPPPETGGGSVFIPRNRAAKAPLPTAVLMDESPRSRSSGFPDSFQPSQENLSGVRGKERFVWYTAAGPLPVFTGFPIKLLRALQCCTFLKNAGHCQAGIRRAPGQLVKAPLYLAADKRYTSLSKLQPREPP